MNKETEKVMIPTGRSMIVHAILCVVCELWFLQFTFDVEIAIISVFAVEIENSAPDMVPGAVNAIFELIFFGLLECILPFSLLIYCKEVFHMHYLHRPLVNRKYLKKKLCMGTK
jgi:hypothetical protein